MPLHHQKRTPSKQRKQPTDQESLSANQASGGARYDDSMDYEDYPVDGAAPNYIHMKSCDSHDDEPLTETEVMKNETSDQVSSTRISRLPQTKPVVSLYRPSTHYLNDPVEERYLNSRVLPDAIFEIFATVLPKTRVLEILKAIELEEERYRMPTDEHGNRLTETNANAFPRKPVVDHFIKVKFTDFEQEEGKQILKYLRNPLLRKSSYGVLLYNSKKQVLGVKNHHGRWSALKGHRKIRDTFEFETIKETASRNFNEKVRVTNLATNEIYRYYDVEREHQLNSSNFIEYRFDGRGKGDQSRTIGLFFIQIDESKLKFDAPNTYENQDCAWLALNDVLDDIPGDKLDQYYTLRPFAETLQSRLMFDADHSTS